MRTPDVVSDAVRAMREAVTIPVSVKHRLGVDDQDRYEDVVRFVSRIVDAGCEWIIVHARKAWLGGLSPHENRTIPPLRHGEVYRLKEEFPGVTVDTNGGVQSLSEVADHLGAVDGVMIGRWAYDFPMGLAAMDGRFFTAGDAEPTAEEVLRRYLGYVREELDRGTRLAPLVQHIHGLFAGRPGARLWRRRLSEGARSADAGIEVIESAIPR